MYPNGIEVQIHRKGDTQRILDDIPKGTYTSMLANVGCANGFEPNRMGSQEAASGCPPSSHPSSVLLSEKGGAIYIVRNIIRLGSSEDCHLERVSVKLTVGRQFSGSHCLILKLPSLLVVRLFSCIKPESLVRARRSFHENWAGYEGPVAAALNLHSILSACMFTASPYPRPPEAIPLR